MSTLVVVAVRDSAIESFGRPVFVPAVGAALRSFIDELKNAESDMGKHPGDFDLYELAFFDDATGLFSNIEGGPFRLLRGKDAAVKEA